MEEETSIRELALLEYVPPDALDGVGGNVVELWKEIYRGSPFCPHTGINCADVFCSIGVLSLDRKQMLEELLFFALRW